MLAVRDLTVGYGEHVVLRDFSVTVPAGSAIMLRGHNGVGKSTLLRCLAGALPILAGTAEVDGQAIDDTATWYRRTVAAQLDDGAWYPALSAVEHVTLIRRANAPVPDEWFTENDLVERLGVAGFADRSPVSLSSGQRQRLALAMVFARPSRLLLLDEPERHLDTAGRGAVADLLRDYVRRGGAAMVATHDTTVSAAGGVLDLDAMPAALRHGTTGPVPPAPAPPGQWW